MKEKLNKLFEIKDLTEDLIEAISQYNEKVRSKGFEIIVSDYTISNIEYRLIVINLMSEQVHQLYSELFYDISKVVDYFIIGVTTPESEDEMILINKENNTYYVEIMLDSGDCYTLQSSEFLMQSLRYAYCILNGKDPVSL